VVVKLSGEALSGAAETVSIARSPGSPTSASVNTSGVVAVVVGGGNYLRGRMAEGGGSAREADNIGMIGPVMTRSC